MREGIYNARSNIGSKLDLEICSIAQLDLGRVSDECPTYLAETTPKC